MRFNLRSSGGGKRKNRFWQRFTTAVVPLAKGDNLLDQGLCTLLRDGEARSSPLVWTLPVHADTDWRYHLWHTEHFNMTAFAEMCAIGRRIGDRADGP